MAEDNIVVKTIENVDKLFSQIVVNGEVFDSERYVEPEPKPVVVKKASVKKAEVTRSTVQTEPQNTTRSENSRSIQGENVYAVELNDILHNFEDRAIVQALSEEAQTRAGADERLQQSITGINSKIPSTASSLNKLADSDSVGASIDNAIGALDVASAGGNGKYIKSISETDGKISAVTGNIDSSVNEGSSNPVTGGAVHSAIQAGGADAQEAIDSAIATEVENRNSAISNAISTEVSNRNTAISNAIAEEVSDRNTAISNAVEALDVASAGGNGKYIKAISETDGKISATTGNIDSSVTAGSSNPVTGGAVDTAINVVKASVEDIEALIPNQATEQNQLADKAFVNSSIATNTANFLGTYTSLAQIQAIPNPTNNDYAYLQTTDSAGNTLYQRYKYSSSDSQWHYEYTLNNSSFTAEQWATINSGLTQESVTAEIGEAIAGEVTARNSAISSAISTEVSNRNIAISNAIDTEVSNRNTAISNAVEALDVASAGGNGKYIKSISETDGKISATTGDIDSSVNSGSSNPVTGGAVATALSGKVDKVTGKGLSTNDFTNALKDKLNGIESGAQVNTVTGVKGSAETDYRTGDISISKGDIGLGNVADTGDSAVPSENGTDKFTTGGAYNLKTELEGKIDDIVDVESSLPTDAILHYSFDDIPDYPDGTAVYFRNKNFTSADNWSCGNGTVTYNNGIVQVVTAGGTYVYKKINFSNCVVKLKVKSAITDNVKVYTSGTVSEQNVTLQANELTELVFYFAGDCTAIGITEIASNNTIEIYAIYIGNGSYSTPIIDNANGQNNATNNGGIAVKGVSGKGLRLLGNGVAFANENIGEKNKTFSCWFSIDNIVPARCIFCKNYNNGFIVLVRNVNNVNTLAVFYYSAGYTNIAQLTANTVYHLVVICGETNVKVYLNGVLVTTINVTVIDNINRLYIGALTNTGINGFYGMIDDFQVFNRALTENEVMALYLNKANTPKYFPTPTSEIKEGSLELATSGGVFATIEKYLKGDVSQETLFAGDLNDIQYGNYFISSASTNLPPQENTVGFLMALYRSSAYQEQLIFFPTTENIYSRACFNGTWRKWNSLKNIFVDKYSYYHNSSLTAPIYFKLYEQKIIGVNYFNFPIHLQGECGMISNDVKAPFDITVDFRTANTTNGVIRGYASNNVGSLVDIIPTWDNDTTTLRIYVAIKARYSFIRLQSSVPLLSPTEESNMTGVAGTSMFNRVTVVGTLQPKTLATPVTVGGVQQATVEGALGALAQTSSSSVETGTVVTSMGSVPQGYLDCSKRMIEKFVENDSLPANYSVNALLQTSDGAIYVGTTSHGIYKSTDGSTFTQLSGFPNRTVYALLQTADGAIYVGTSAQGIYKSTDGSTFTQLSGLPTDRTVRALLQTSDGTIYVGTTSHGIYKSTDGSTFTQLSGLPTDRTVRALLQTSDGAIYVGTTSHGIYKSTDGSTFTQLSGFSVYTTVYALLQTSDGAIYVGSSVQGFYKSTDGSTFTQLSGFPTALTVYALLQTSDGAIYVGTDSYGIYKSTDGSTFTQLSGLPTALTVYALLQTSDGAIYVGGISAHGIYKSVPFRELSKTTYADLYTVVGDKFNVEAGVTDNTKFAIPLVGNDKLTYMVKV